MNLKILIFPKYLALFIFGFFLVTSCADDYLNDDQKPTIESIRFFDNTATEKYSFEAGDEMFVEMQFKDDIDLGDYVMEIHYAGEGHYHYQDQDNSYILSSDKWELRRTGKIAGKETKVVEYMTVDIQANASPYHCIVYATDNFGNYADFKVQPFLVSTEDMPEISIENIDFDNDVSIAVNDTLKIVSKIRAVKGLSKAIFQVRKIATAEKLLPYNETVLFSNSEKEVSFDRNIIIKDEFGPGLYLGIILASDKGGSVGEKLFLFEVTAK
jgi:hypothetical protein